MGIDMSLLYYTKAGKPTIPVDDVELERVVIYRVVRSTGWNESQIYSQFDVSRYLWGQTGQQAVSAICRDIAEFERAQR